MPYWSEAEWSLTLAPPLPVVRGVRVHIWRIPSISKPSSWHACGACGHGDNESCVLKARGNTNSALISLTNSKKHCTYGCMDARRVALAYRSYNSNINNMHRTITARPGRKTTMTVTIQRLGPITGVSDQVAHFLVREIQAAKANY